MVRETSSAGQRTISPRAQRFPRVRRELGLDADDAGVRPERPDRRRDAARQPAAADRDEDGGEIGQVLDDLETDGALAGDDPVVVVRRDDRQAALGARSPRRPAGARRWRSRPTTISAPSAATRSRLIAGASDGMTTTAGAPSSRAARATPWAWLPDE